MRSDVKDYFTIKGVPVDSLYMFLRQKTKSVKSGVVGDCFIRIKNVDFRVIYFTVPLGRVSINCWVL